MAGNKDRRLPRLAEDRYRCCGCAACASICPRGAVEMAEDGEGFLYPRVDGAACSRCLLCERTCPWKGQIQV